MFDIKLFQIQDQHVTELTGSAAKIEKSLQSQIEANLETYLGVRFLTSLRRSIFLWCNEAIMNLCPDTPPLEAGATGKGLRSRSYVTRMNGKEYYACPRCGALFRNAKSRLRLRLM